MFPDTDKRRLEEVVYRNCFHHAVNYTPQSGTCTRTDKDAIAKCGAHGLLGAFPSTQDISWCAVLRFYHWLTEQRYGQGDLGKRECHLGDTTPLPAPEPKPERPGGYYDHDSQCWVPYD